MPPPPPSLLIHRLVYGYAINPGLETGLGSKPAQAFVDFQESLLRRITRLFRIAQQSKAERVNGALEMSDQFFKRSQITSAQPCNQPYLRRLLKRS